MDWGKLSLLLLVFFVVLIASQDNEETVLESDNTNEDKWASEENLIQTIIDRIDTENLREYHKFLAGKPHLAATPRDEETAHYIRDKFEEAGFDKAELKEYTFLLSKPDTSNPNKITIQNGSETVFTSRHMEDPIHPDDSDPNFVHAFNAYTPAGTVSTAKGSGLVYVNYGTVEDFDRLREMGINISGHIALIRFGKIYRGNKIVHAEKAGAIGVILYSDPEDVAAEGIAPADVYDNTWWMPGSGMQRGSTYLMGDPSTPGWPSTDNALRLEIGEMGLHNIPAQPIGYDDAKQLMQLMGGGIPPEDWVGTIPNIPYTIGPEFLPEYSDHSVTLSTHNSEKFEKSYNVIGIIKGSVEPDRYVMLGNHRDAWGYGAVDPTSGTTQMLETARVLGTLVKEGWRPRRSIVFHSWGSEEFGIIGSKEFVEENVNKLQDRTIAYVNTDSCASGPILGLSSSPLLAQSANTIMPLIPGVVDSSKTLFDEWKEYAIKTEAATNGKTPKIDLLGGGSDHEHFAFYAGIPSININFGMDKTKSNVSSYPAYHTGYDTLYYFTQFIDPDYKIVQGCGRMASLMLKLLADSSVIPFDPTTFAQTILDLLQNYENRDKLISIYDKYEVLEDSVSKFIEETKAFSGRLNAQSLSPLELRTVNDQMMKLEQIFIIPEGLPGRSTVRNALFATSQFDSYASGGFPGLTDLLYGYDDLKGEEKSDREFQIKKHISDLTIMVDRASAYLMEVDQF